VSTSTASGSCRVGIDVGGTFNDFVLADSATGEIIYFKEPSVPDDPSLAVERGIRGLLKAAHRGPGAIGLIVHGTTLGLNTILQRRGARLALVVSRGNRDVLEIARSRMPAAYDFTAGREIPLVPRDFVFEIDARIAADGAILARPDPAGYDGLAVALRRAEVEAVAVMLLNSYRHPTLEVEVAEALGKRLDGVPVTPSAAVWPELREYERSLLACLNAYVHPMLDSYFEKLTNRLAALGIAAPIQVTTNSGGVMSLASARRRPIDTLLSGPASGVSAALRVSPAATADRMITLDMGGTSTDIALIRDREPEFTIQARVGDYPLMLPVVSVNAIGAGGGSIVWIDDQRILKVGPQSAGANPGPACYGLGGKRATITDCYLVLGILDPGFFLGGRMRLEPQLAEAALEEVAVALGLHSSDRSARAASAILSVATTKMAVELSKLLARRGYDHREFALLAFGGAGPTHACLLAEEAKLASVVIPAAPGTFCALGAVLADLRRDYARSLNCLVAAKKDFSPVAAALADLKFEASRWLQGEGAITGTPKFIISAEMRYPAQAYELSVAVPECELGALDGARLAACFHDEHERLYGFAERHLPARINTLRISVIGRRPPVRLPECAGGRVSAPSGARRVFHGGDWVEAALYYRKDLPAGATLRGPALIEQHDTTVWVLPGWRGITDSVGNLLLSR
jgi:N-methylhydantoinase A